MKILEAKVNARRAGEKDGLGAKADWSDESQYSEAVPYEKSD